MEKTFKTPDLFSENLPKGYATALHGPAWHFADMAELANAASDALSRPLWHTRVKDNSDRFSGCSIDEAFRLAREGWPEGAKIAEALRDRIALDRPQAPRTVRYDVAGALPNIPRAIAGNPAHMRRMAPADTRTRPILTLAIGIAAGANLKASAMLASAAAAAAVIDTLESAGFRCNVLAVWRTAQWGTTFGQEMAIQAKAPGDPASLATLSFALGHPAMLRRLCFLLLAGESSARTLTEGLGQPTAIKPNPDAGVYTLAPARETNTGDDATAAFDAMIASLRTQGCPGIPAA